MRRASAGKGCIMKVIRTRIVVALASSAVVASGFGLTAFAVSSANSATTMLSASQSVAQVCPNGTIIDYGKCA
jgi:conjugal transfer/entry exclusion protein